MKPEVEEVEGEVPRFIEVEREKKVMLKWGSSLVYFDMYSKGSC